MKYIALIFLSLMVSSCVYDPYYPYGPAYAGYGYGPYGAVYPPPPPPVAVAPVAVGVGFGGGYYGGYGHRWR